MDIIRRNMWIGSLLLPFAAAARAQTPAPEISRSNKLKAPRRRPKLYWPAPTGTLDLWPHGSMTGAPVDLKEEVEETSRDPNTHLRRVRGITHPRVAVFPAEHPNGAAMLIIPGGGFIWNYFDHEGYQLADILNKNGITCYVLFYRLAQDGWQSPADVGLIDAQRAMRLIKFHAPSANVDPERVGVIGFSAGGYLAANLATRHSVNFYEGVDRADQLSARPALAGLVYAVQSADPSYAYADLSRVLFKGSTTSDIISRYSPDRNVQSDSSPCFIVHAEDDDAVPVENALRLREALRTKSIPVETHLFATGGHGFGVKMDIDKPYHVWPSLLVNFARALKVASS